MASKPVLRLRLRISDHRLDDFIGPTDIKSNYSLQIEDWNILWISPPLPRRPFDDRDIETINFLKEDIVNKKLGCCCDSRS